MFQFSVLSSTFGVFCWQVHPSHAAVVVCIPACIPVFFFFCELKLYVRFEIDDILFEYHLD